ncbi:MAG TPA: TIGR03032 family protein [Flavobacteriales bacterium]|nr:TIGR03032 family protein [Flavobacteriales bacterium]
METHLDKVTPPFSCQFTPQVPELLLKLNCTLALSTYQAGKVILLSAANEHQLNVLPRTFNKAMGIAVDGNRMAIATRDEIIKLVNVPELGTHYPNQPGKYTSLFVPRATYYTGNVDMHDLEFGVDGLWAINTSFSCLCLINDDYSFIPKWTPPFITELVSQDRCHLNGLTLVNGKPKYVTALGQGNTTQSWRGNIEKGGILMDVETNEIILKDLPMPHSPRLYKGELYMALSASGDVIRVDVKNKSYEVIRNLEGFVRGIAIVDDYMFVGMSKLRKNSSTFAKLPFAEKASEAGIKILHIPTKAYVGSIKFKSSVDEIYDLQLIAGDTKVGILNTINEIHKYSLSIPGATFWATPKSPTENT